MAKDDIKLVDSQVVPVEEVGQDEGDLILFEPQGLSVFEDELTDTLIEADASGAAPPPIDGGIIGTGGSDDDDEDDDDNEASDYNSASAFEVFDANEGSLQGVALAGVGDDSESALLPAVHESALVASGWVVCLIVGVLFQIYGFSILVNRML